jgi:hypothetical protein
MADLSEAKKLDTIPDPVSFSSGEPTVHLWKGNYASLKNKNKNTIQRFKNIY